MRKWITLMEQLERLPASHLITKFMDKGSKDFAYTLWVEHDKNGSFAKIINHYVFISSTNDWYDINGLQMPDDIAYNFNATENDFIYMDTIDGNISTDAQTIIREYPDQYT